MIITPPEARDSIIVVRRSPGKKRWFTHHDGIFKMVQKLGEERGLRLELLLAHVQTHIYFLRIDVIYIKQKVVRFFAEKDISHVKCSFWLV